MIQLGIPSQKRSGSGSAAEASARKLALLGYDVSYHTVCRLLRKLGYSLKVNVKHRAATVGSPKRDAQFCLYCSAARRIPRIRMACTERRLQEKGVNRQLQGQWQLLVQGSDPSQRA